MSVSLAGSMCIGTVIAAPALEVDPNDPRRLLLGLREVNFLLSNWDKKTTYCNFGEFQNELLAPDKKDELFAAASKFAILDYDKSETMNIRCKKDPQVVRAFVGLTNENLLLKNAEKLMLKPTTIDMVDGDDLDQYQENVDAFILAVSEVDQLSYAARTDHDSTETFSREEGGTSIKSQSGQDYLSQSKIAVEKLQKALEGVVGELHLK